MGINDADYAVQPYINGKRRPCPYYVAWVNMLMRCYSAVEHQRHPTYIGCSVGPEWHPFMGFRSWMVKQLWAGNQLDKDLLIPGNCVYGPKACLYVPRWLNMMFLDSGRSRGRWPQGVCQHQRSKRFEAWCQVGHKQTYIGTFACPLEAGQSYIAMKTKYVRSRYPEIEKIDPRLVPACERKLDQLTINLKEWQHPKTLRDLTPVQ